MAKKQVKCLGVRVSEKLHAYCFRAAWHEGMFFSDFVREALEERLRKSQQIRRAVPQGIITPERLATVAKLFASGVKEVFVNMNGELILPDNHIRYVDCQHMFSKDAWRKFFKNNPEFEYE